MLRCSGRHNVAWRRERWEGRTGTEDAIGIMVKQHKMRDKRRRDVDVRRRARRQMVERGPPAICLVPGGILGLRGRRHSRKLTSCSGSRVDAVQLRARGPRKGESCSDGWRKQSEIRSGERSRPQYREGECRHRSRLIWLPKMSTSVRPGRAEVPSGSLFEGSKQRRRRLVRCLVRAQKQCSLSKTSATMARRSRA